MFFSMKGFLRLLFCLSSALTAVVLIYVLADQDIVSYLGLARNRYF